MAFSNLTFLFGFLPLALLLYYVTPKRGKNLVLALSGLLFYAWGEPLWVLLLLGLFAVHYAAGLGVGRAGAGRGARAFWLALPALLDFGCLAFFKAAPLFGGTPAPPLGLSFFLLQALTYPVGVWRGECAPQKNPIDLAAYAFFFPKLLAGPVTPYAKLSRPLRDRGVTWDGASDGAGLFLQGLAKKALLADSLLPVWETVRAAGPAAAPTLNAWVGLLAFTLGLYFDLSGYADMAVGLGRMFGFELPRNMEHPFAAKTVRGFWRRWQSTLTGWFGDYIFRPLAGERGGKLRAALSAALAGAAFGLWHGFSRNLLLWGLYLAGLVLLERYVWGGALKSLPAFLQRALTWLLVLLGWTLFFADSPAETGLWLAALFGGNHVGFADGNSLFFLVSNLLPLVIAGLGASMLPARLAGRMRLCFPRGFQAAAGAARLLLFAAALCAIAVRGGQPFYYFRF